MQQNNNEQKSGLEKPLSHYFVKGEASKRLYDVSATGVGLINSFLTISYLSVFHFGLFQLILAFVNILDGLTVKSLDGPIATEMRHYIKAKEPAKAKRIFKEMVLGRILFALTVGIALFFGADAIASFYGDDIALLVKIVSPLLLIYALHSLETVFFESIISFAHWSFPAIREVSKLVFVGTLIFFGAFNITTLVVAHVAANALAALLLGSFVFIKKYWQTFKHVGAHREYLIFQFLKDHGKWLFIRFGFSRITKNAMPWLIKFFVNTDAVAFYSLALNAAAFAEGFMPISGITPLFLLKLGDNRQLSFLFKRSVKYVFWLGVFFMVGSLIAGPLIITLVFPRYAEAMPLLRVMLLALPIFGVYKILKSLLSALRQYKVLAMRMLNEALVMVGGSFILLPVIGIIGAGVVYVMTYIERVWFFYSQLIKKYPEFKLKAQHLFSFDRHDIAIIKSVSRRILKRS